MKACQNYLQNLKSGDKIKICKPNLARPYLLAGQIYKVTSIRHGACVLCSSYNVCVKVVIKTSTAGPSYSDQATCGCILGTPDD